MVVILDTLALPISGEGQISINVIQVGVKGACVWMHWPSLYIPVVARCSLCSLLVIVLYRYILGLKHQASLYLK